MGRLVGEQLGVPLDAQEGTVVDALHCLDDSVWGPRHRTQARTYVCDRLVVEAVHAERSLAGDRRQETAGIDLHEMYRLAIPFVFPVGFVSADRQVLDESAPRSHVEHLGAPAHPEDW